jgi:lysozyme family protein
MANIQVAQAAMVDALALLMKRRINTTDNAEKDKISDAIDELNGMLEDLNQASLLQAASDVAQATQELQGVVSSVRLGPFDTYLADLQTILQRLQALQSTMHASEALPRTPELPPPAAGVTAGDKLGMQAAQPSPAGVPAPAKNSTSYDALRSGYLAYFDACVPGADHAANVKYYIAQITKSQSIYEGVGGGLHIPWFFIAILHGLECGFNFNEHLHNGDPLSARTTHVPAGRPMAGPPPFTWVESANDALVFEGFAGQDDWSTARILYRFERYNGFGYRPHGVPSPYLWSFSNLYTKGKFSSDGHFDPNAVSRQCGAGVILKALQQQGIIQLSR